MFDNLTTYLNSLVQAAIAMGIFLAALWLIYFVDALLFRGKLKQRFGLIPRGSFAPLRILFSPFFHVDLGHLAANSLPFFVLGTLALSQGSTAFWLATLLIIIMAGLGVWLLGKSGTQHIGASGLILGYFGYLLANVIFNTDLLSLVIAVVVGVLYLGLITQIVPLKKGLSTTGHLFGFLGGVLASFLLSLL